jgi:hypothetical protein
VRDCANIGRVAGRSTSALGLACVLGALGVAGCGSTNTTSASTPAVRDNRVAHAARRQFVAQASAVCASAGAQERPLKAREQALKGEPVAEANQAFVSLAREAASIAHNADERLRALKEPPAEAAKVQQLLQAYSEEANDAREIANAVAHQENNVGEAVSSALSKLIAGNVASAERLGMGECFTLE